MLLELGDVETRRGVSASMIREAKFGKSRVDQAAIKAGVDYHHVLSQKIQERKIPEIRDLGLFQTEIGVEGQLGKRFNAKARADVVCLSWVRGAMDIVEGKLHSKMTDMDVVQAGVTASAFFKDRYLGRLAGDCNYFFCLGWNFRLLKINFEGMLGLEQDLCTLAQATLAYQDEGGSRILKTQRGSRLHGDFMMAFTNYYHKALKFFG